MIALALLHPQQLQPVHRWTFDRVSVIRIGRSRENDVVLYSAVISRYHLELHHRGGEWWIVNLGQNGTYVNNVAIEEVRLTGELTLCLARSGPRLQIAQTNRLLPVPRSLPQVNDLVSCLDEDDATIADANLMSLEVLH